MRTRLFMISTLVGALCLAGCTGRDGNSGKALAADDLWDRMAALRDKPAPVPEAAIDEEADRMDLPEDLGIGPRPPLSDAEQEIQRAILLEGPAAYEKLKARLEAALAQLTRGGQDADDRQRFSGAVELQLSRLTSLQSQLRAALDDLTGSAALTPALKADSRALLLAIEQQLRDARLRLDRLTSS